MKKILLTTTLLVATAGMAAAEVTFGGYGRFGLTYTDIDGLESDTRLQTRLRININTTLETDTGLTFGGRIRLQHDAGRVGARLSAAKLFVEASGFRVEVGNTDTAYDNAGLMYATEIGFTDSSLGESQDFAYYGFSSGPYSDAEADRMGIYASYSVGDFTGRISIVDPNQSDDPLLSAGEEEISISFDYVTGPFSISLAAVQDGAGIADNDQFFAGVAYAIGDSANVGLNYHDEKDVDDPLLSDVTVISLYGNTTLANGLTIAGYITSVDTDASGSETGGGIGASYPIGEGAKVAGAIHTLDDVTFADLGVRFDF
jgi:outer membrane protein OmpU